jgi:hypothetical protein
MRTRTLGWLVASVFAFAVAAACGGSKKPVETTPPTVAPTGGAAYGGGAYGGGAYGGGAYGAPAPAPTPPQ